ncbi:MAG: nickel-dependent lactate racemase [Deltaproteobacteria bacterium]|nr:nickel-dependent lactate racemase [Deltaproteobacteria bacterium]
MHVELLYGRRGLKLELPDEIETTVIRKHPMTPLHAPQAAVRNALAHPVDAPPLAGPARGGKSACILICDITRPVPNGIILPPLIDTLLAAGLDPARIRVLVATGLHRPNEGKELREIVGSDEVLSTVTVENHFARDREAHADLGITPGGVPIMIDRRFVEADLKIVTGLVEPHFMAGYSGGRKVVAPGVAYQDTILMFHTAHVLEHPNASNCVVEGNPLHQEQLEIVRALGDVLAFGEIESSHLLAVDFMRKHAEVKVPRKFKTVVTTSAGYPLDKTYYQTVKGMVGVIDILEPGGDIIIASECSEGMGSREFVDAQRALCRMGPDAFMAMLETREKALIDEWQTEMLVKALRVGNVRLYATGLAPEDLRDIYVEPISSVEEAVLASVEKHADPRIAVVPEGPYVIPLFQA